MKSRVLIVNKFYYPRGGDCVCTLNLERLLKEKGYDVAIYAMDYPENIVCESSKYFASQVDFSGGIKNKLQAVIRTLGMGDIKRSYKKMLDDFNPDIVHLQNIHSYLSPILAKIAKDRGCKVVWTLHDYKLLCPSYSCLRDGEPCELCFNDKTQVLKKKCMKNSLVASALAYIEALKWNKKYLQQYTDTFICPSSFMKDKMEQGGYSKDKLSVICNFVDPVKLEMLQSLPADNRKDYYLYVGRLSKEKGVETLLSVAKKLNYKLVIAGGGPMEEELRREYCDCKNIKFVGHQSAEDVARLLYEARFAVVPSECYENNPLSVIEALCAGTPVIGADMGGIPELISNDGGVIFPSKDADSLLNAIKEAWNKEWNYAEVKAKSLSRFSPQYHYDQLVSIYNRKD